MPSKPVSIDLFIFSRTRMAEDSSICTDMTGVMLKQSTSMPLEVFFTNMMGDWSLFFISSKSWSIVARSRYSDNVLLCSDLIFWFSRTNDDIARYMMEKTSKEKQTIANMMISMFNP